MYVLICLQASSGRCAETELSSYWSCETTNKQCGSCILTTKRVTQTNYYDTLNVPLVIRNGWVQRNTSIVDI